MAGSLTLFFLAAAATEVRSAFRSSVTSRTSVNRFLPWGPSLFGSHPSRNQLAGETWQVRVARLFAAKSRSKKLCWRGNLWSAMAGAGGRGMRNLLELMGE